ncbi:MAG: stimulus-sensing domain-containing protein [Cucumibacter sp.]
MAISGAEAREQAKRTSAEPDRAAPPSPAPAADALAAPGTLLGALTPAAAPPAAAGAPSVLEIPAGKPALHSEAPATPRPGIIRSAIQGFNRLLSLTILASLTRRIVVLNLAALAALVSAILYLNTWRAGLIDARVQSLRVQGEIIAGAIASSATVDSDVITVDPDRFLQLQSGEVTPLSFFDPALEFPINPERVAPLLRNLVTPTGTRARIYDSGGLLILDSTNIYARGDVIEAPAATGEGETSFFLVAWWDEFFRWLRAGEFPLYQEYPGDQGNKYPEVVAAFDGKPASITRVDMSSRLVVSVAVPIKRVNVTVGVLLLSTNPGEIDNIVESERWGILMIFLVAAAITFLLSLLMAGTIAGPMRRLSAAAKRVETSMTAREQIPAMSDRTDEIGHLAASLRSMTNALYNRIEAIEKFAADVSHELKNPLTSLRSAVETLPRARSDADRARLAEIIKHDVRRIDRLISDISSASRLDAELAREAIEIVDLRRLLETIVAIQNEVATLRGARVLLIGVGAAHAPTVRGQDTRLAQIFTNLIDNAVSFTPDGGTVTVRLVVRAATVCVEVMDEGPGIRGDISRVFTRFYTDRPEGESFGNHSGLGLAISKQIVEAHKGKIDAGNRKGTPGAIFTVTLPRAAH